MSFAVATTVGPAARADVTDAAVVPGHAPLPRYRGAGFLSGSVDENASNLAGVTMRLYDRATGMLIESTITDASGDYSFSQKATDSEKFFIIAFDKAGGVNYNAMILDKLTAA